MGEERKQTKQSLEIENKSHISLSELLETVPKGFQYTVLVNNLTVSEKDFKKFKSNEIVIPFSLVVYENLSGSIEERDAKQTLTFKEDLRVGREINIENISIEVKGDLDCEGHFIAHNIGVRGDLNSECAIESTGEVNVRGDLNCGGVVRADECIDVRGDVWSVGLESPVIDIRGNIEADGTILTNSMSVGGDVMCQCGASILKYPEPVEFSSEEQEDEEDADDDETTENMADEITVRGCLYVEGDIRAGEIYVRQNLTCEEEIITFTIIVKGKLACDSIYGYDDGEMEVGRLEADAITGFSEMKVGL